MVKENKEDNEQSGLPTAHPSSVDDLTEKELETENQELRKLAEFFVDLLNGDEEVKHDTSISDGERLLGKIEKLEAKLSAEKSALQPQPLECQENGEEEVPD